MHHFIYPSQDTFITDTTGFDNLNFGLDETLRVGTQNVTLKTVSPTTTYPFPPNTVATNLCVQGFSGSISTGSFYGTASFVQGFIFNTSEDPVSFTIDYFSGSIVGSLDGWLNGAPYSASNVTGSVNGFSGSIVVQSITSNPTWDELLLEYQNWTNTWDAVEQGSGSISGLISGSLVTSFLGVFNGSISNLTGKFLTATINGADILPNQNTSITVESFRNRALVQFDISAISASVASGDILNPDFKLKLFVAREHHLPIRYNVYAFPISESWVMGNGYISDNGSTQGASWIYRDSSGGTPWTTTGSSYVQSLSITQSFNYQVGDIDMDVTPIVNAWISGSIPNNGIVLVSSDETNSTGSGIGLYFFSKDTNTIFEPILDVGWDDSTWSTGSVTTASINIGTIPAGLLGTVVNSASISGSIFGGFTGVGNITVETDLTASGLMDVVGTSGLILSMSIIGNMSGSVSSSIVTIYRLCNSCTPIFNAGWPWTGGQFQGQYQGLDVYGWGHQFATFNQYDWWTDQAFQQEFGPGFAIDFCHTGSHTGSHSGSMVTMSIIMGTLIDGTFSGSTFTSSFLNGYRFGKGFLVGNWNESMIDGTNISSSYPFKPMFPNAINVGFSGLYVNGNAFGSITALSASMGLVDYGIFDGVFFDGPLVGSKIHAPFTGSILTSSYSYTSSINLVSSSLTPIDLNKPFTTTLQNIKPTVKAGDILRVNVFARSQFPLKNFNRQTQFTQFLIPQYLPTSSYYAIKDNETEQTVLDFDSNTKLSCDQNGNFFDLDTTGLPQERYFKILIRTEQNGNTYTFDRNGIFKIVR